MRIVEGILVTLGRQSKKTKCEAIAGLRTDYPGHRLCETIVHRQIRIRTCPSGVKCRSFNLNSQMKQNLWKEVQEVAPTLTEATWNVFFASILVSIS
jgi:hypothetical protein